METLPPGSCAQMPQERLWCEFSRPDRKIPTSYPLENHCHCFPWCVPKRHSHFYLFISIIWKAKKQWQKQKKTTTERKKISPILTSSIACNGWSCDKPNARARNSILLSHMGARKPSILSHFHYLPMCTLARSWIQEWSQDSNTHTTVIRL